MGYGDNQFQENEEEKEEDILMEPQNLLVTEAGKIFGDMKPRLGKLWTQLSQE